MNEPKTASEQLLFSTVRIETKTSGGSGTGTGFAFCHNVDGNNYPFIITNKHVIANSLSGSLYFTQSSGNKPTIGKAYKLDINDNFESIWYGHKDPEIDVAITPLAPLLTHINKTGYEIYIPWIGSELIPNENSISEIDLIETVTFFGYPNGIWDNVNFLPIVRRGVTASPISLNFQGKKQFIIDASVFPGSSGSPVFIINTGMYTNKFGSTHVASRLIFLGIIAAVYFRTDTNEIQIKTEPAKHIPVSVNREMIDLGIVFKAETIIETITWYLKEKSIIKA